MAKAALMTCRILLRAPPYLPLSAAAFVHTRSINETSPSLMTCLTSHACMYTSGYLPSSGLLLQSQAYSKALAAVTKACHTVPSKVVPGFGQQRTSSMANRCMQAAACMQADQACEWRQQVHQAQQRDSHFAVCSHRLQTDILAQSPDQTPQSSMS